jgi:CheY-like chemotaxis protein/tRNA A-37 threonylcarbamoyl transferase component Bud32
MRTISRRYELDREIGRGAAGSVWMARDRQLQRRVAIKLLRADCVERQGLRTRFEREALTIAQVRSPYVVQVYDVGVDEGQPYIVMEWLDGESLEEVLRRHIRMPLPTTVELVTHLARGLSLTHAAGIVHRDVKPANIFVAREHGRHVPKLLDFGVATLLSGLAGNGGAPPIAGTPQFMSPEQASGRELDGRSDLWSLGVVAYAMLSGHLPFEAEDFPALRALIAGRPHEPPSRHHGALSALVDDFFAVALAKDPAARFQTATDLAAALLRAAETRAPSPIRILLLDDEPDMELLLRNRFRREIREGMYEILFATDGQAGLQVLEGRTDIDVVLTDINMPGMDGLTFLAHVGKVNPAVRVVVVSAYNDMANLRLAMNRGAFDFLVKPIDFDDLQVTIEKCASHVAILRQAERSRAENGLLRLLVGRSELEGLGTTGEEIVEGAVGFLTLEGLLGGLESPLRLLDDLLALLLPELVLRQATVIRVVGFALMVVFRGDDHAGRALEACLAARERVRAVVCQDGDPGAGVALGLEAGPLAIGRVGAEGGGLEPVVLGAPVSRALALCFAAGRDRILVGATMHERLDPSFLRQPAGVVQAAHLQVPALAVVGRAEPAGASPDRLTVTVTSPHTRPA